MTPAHRNLGDIVAKRARTDAARVALVDPLRNVAYTWAELDRRRRQLANVLRGCCGRSGRVATVLPIGSVAAELVYAAATAGVILVPVNERLTPHELAFVFADAEVAVIVTTADHLATVATAAETGAPGARIVVVEPLSHDTGALPYGSALLAAPDTELPDAAEPGDIAMLIYTSGTTGRPKGVMLTHANFLSSAGNYLMESITPGDGTYLACVPYSHVGCVVHLAAAMRGLTTVVTPFAPDRVLALIEGRRVSHVALVPTMIALLLDAENSDCYDCSSLRRILYAAAPMPASLLERALRRFGPVLEQFYGLTESTGLVTILRHDEHLSSGDGDHAAVLASCGREVTGACVDVINTDGRSVAGGERGEIVVRGPGVMAGYWRNRAATEAAITDGWLHTGDVGSRNADGYVTIIDRLKDVIITGGSNVYPKEVELVLEAVPGVKEVAVVGVEDETWGEVVTALVSCEADGQMSEEILRATCQSELAPYKQPRRFRFTDALPRNALGKIDKVKVREEMAGRPEHAPAR